MSRSLIVLLLASGLALGACASDEATGSVTYSGTARRNYEKGVEELKDDNYPEAMKYFQFVRQKFPFSKFATLAELRIADTNFERERYAEAIDQYRTFIRSHPTHELVQSGYVSYKTADAYFRQVPDDFWLSPPAYEKDQTPTLDALKELDSFLERFGAQQNPTTQKYVKEARKARAHCAKLLAQHELAVARYYLSGVTQNAPHPRAALWRAEGALKSYGETGMEPEALLIKGEAHLDLKEHQQARETFAELAKRYPRTAQGRRAQRQLDRLSRLPPPKAPPPKPAPPPAPTPPPAG